MTSFDLVAHGNGWVPCSSCCAFIPYELAAFDPWFNGDGVECPECHGSIDWWSAVLTTLKDHFSFGWSIALAGATLTMFNTRLPVGESRQIDLSQIGVPDGAEVLEMNLTSGGSATPVLLHGNDAMHPRLGTKFWLHGRKPHQGDGSGPLSAMVVWFAPRQDQPAQLHLVEAGREYAHDRFDAVVIPANVAAEVAIGTAVGKARPHLDGPHHVGNTLPKGATYNQQLNVLLNVAADAAGIPRLQDHIRGLLNRLRGFRNEVAHRGKCQPQNRELAAEHLAAAIFGVRYADLLSRTIGPRAEPAEEPATEGAP